MYKQLIARFPQFSVLVIGDLMLDVYLKGFSSRISPEAPVPVVDILSHNTVLGGGANTAVNLRYLGAGVTFCGVVGKDKNGEMAIELLEKAGIDSRVIQHSSRQTMVKTRVTAGNQTLVRYDSGSEEAITAEVEKAFISLLREQFPLHDAIVIADYNKGLLTPAVISLLELMNQQCGKFIAVDSKRLECFRCLSPTLVKPNYQEAVQLLRLQQLHSNRVKQIDMLGTEVFVNTGAAITAVTLDEEGAVIFSENKMAYRSYAHQGISAQVSGAGDAYISAFTLAYLAGADIPAAAELSAATAAVAINKNTTACCTHEELSTYLSINEKYVTDPSQLQHISAMYKAQGKKIVFTNGCFDILHSGHVNYLNRARELGHVLIVGINSDESIRRLKGNSRPINHLHDRVEVLSGLAAVNHVVAFGSEKDDTPVPLITAIQPDFFAKGGDYTKDTLPEATLVEQLGGQVILLPLLPDRSTTLILHKIHMNHIFLKPA